MALHFREISKQDQPILWDMLFWALHVPPGQQPFSRSILDDPAIARYAQNWGRIGDVGLLALHDVGVGAIWSRLWREEQGFGFIAPEIPELSMAVVPEKRGQGIGTALLNLLLEKIYPHYPGVSLSVSESNPACHLYMRFGFRPIERKRDSIVMVKYF